MAAYRGQSATLLLLALSTILASVTLAVDFTYDYSDTPGNNLEKFPYQPDDCATQPQHNSWDSEVLSVMPLSADGDYEKGTRVCLSLKVKPDGECKVYNDAKWNVPPVAASLPDTLPGMKICCNPDDPRLAYYKLRVNTNCKCRSAFKRIGLFYPRSMSSAPNNTKPMAWEAVDLDTATYNSRGIGDVYLTRYDTQNNIPTSEIRDKGPMAICFDIVAPCPTLADIATTATTGGSDRANQVVSYALYTPRLSTGRARPTNFYECCPTFNISMADVCTKTGMNTAGCGRVTSSVDGYCPPPPPSPPPPSPPKPVSAGRRLIERNDPTWLDAENDGPVIPNHDADEEGAPRRQMAEEEYDIAPSYVDGNIAVVDLDLEMVRSRR